MILHFVPPRRTWTCGFWPLVARGDVDAETFDLIPGTSDNNAICYFQILDLGLEAADFGENRP